MHELNFNDLRGKVAVITGGSGVIGNALVRAMAKAGIKVAITGRTEQSAAKVAQEISQECGGQVIGVAGNVLDKAGLVACKKVINERLGPIDIVVNCAGGNKPTATTAVEQMTPANLEDLSTSFYGLDVDGFDEVFALNFQGTLLPTLVFTTDMLGRGGVVINISSMSAFNPLTKVPAYSAAKSAVNNLTQWLAVHLARMDIRVNAIAPGFFLTNQNRAMVTDIQTGEPTARGRKIIANTPMGRFGEVEELQGILLFLLSDMARFMTGVVIPVDGGYSAFGGV